MSDYDSLWKRLCGMPAPRRMRGTAEKLTSGVAYAIAEIKVYGEHHGQRK